MNFYKRFMGDIQAKTGHLSLAEFGAYDRLLDHVYSTEQPLPGDVARCYGIARAMSKHDRSAVDAVLAEFFTLTANGYEQGRAAEMIAEAQPKIAAARENGKRGGRPPKPKTQQEPTGFSTETQQEPNAEPKSKPSQNQSQIPSSQSSEGERKRSAPMPRPDDVAQQTWSDWTALRKAKKTTVSITAVDEARREAAKAGLTLERFLQVWCSRGSQGLLAEWLKPHERGNPTATGETPYQRSMRERVEVFAPEVAARAPGAQTFIEEIQLVPAIASR